MAVRSRTKSSVNTAITIRGPRSSGTAEVREQFPGSPELNGYNEDEALRIYQDCLNGVQSDNTDFEMGVNMDYADAPSISTEVIPSDDDYSYVSPYVPNPRAPTTSNPADFVKWEGSEAWATGQKVEQFPLGHGGTSSGLDPSVSSAAIAGVEIKDIPGSSGPTEV